MKSFILGDLVYTIIEGTLNVSVGSNNIEIAEANISSTVKNLEDSNVYTVTIISKDAFLNCLNLTSITIPIGITIISNCAFAGCLNLTSVIIPEGVRIIGSNSFQDCKNLTSVKFIKEPRVKYNPNYIGENAFHNCSSLSSIALPGDFETIGNSAFQGCSKLQTVIMESINVFSFDGDRYIKKYVDNYNCEKKTISPMNGTRIGDNAFQDCSSLQNIIIRANISKLGVNIFQGCSSLQTVTLTNIYNIYNIYTEVYSIYKIEKLSILTKKLQEIVPRSCRVSSIINTTIDYVSVDKKKYDKELELLYECLKQNQFNSLNAVRKIRPGTKSKIENK